MAAQQEVAFSLAERRVGSRFEVLIDERLESDLVVGRHAGQAPEVDSVTYVRETAARPGALIPVQCTGRKDYDLCATGTDMTRPVPNG